MNYSEIEAFLTVIRSGSITGAAERLFISQSTISQRIKSLENKLEVNLLTRGKGIKNVELTQSGEEFYALALKMESIIGEAKMLKEKRYKNDLSIAAIDSVHNYIMQNLYRSIMAKDNEVNYFFRTHQSLEIYTLLENNEIGIGLVQQEKFSKSLINEVLFTEELVLVMNREIDIRLLESVRELDPKKEIYLNWGYNFRIWHEKEFGYEGTLGVQVDTGLLLGELLEEPGFWGIVPVSIAKQYVKERNIKVIRFTGNTPERTCFAVYDKHNEKVKPALEVIYAHKGEIMEKILADEDLFDGRL